MAIETELCLPQLIMPETPGSEIIALSGSEIKEVMGLKLPKAIDAYITMLSEDSSYYRKEELARSSEEALKIHIQQLGVLKEFLEAFGQNPSSFISRVNDISLDDKTYKARLKRADDPPLGEGEENAQIQLSFFAQLSESEEEREAAISGASIKGVSPAAAIRRADREVRGGRITINTVQIYQPRDSSRTLVSPQGGIAIVREGDFIDLYGVKFVGKTTHQASVPNEGDISIPDYHVARELTKRLASSRIITV